MTGGFSHSDGAKEESAATPLPSPAFLDPGAEGSAVKSAASAIASTLTHKGFVEAAMRKE
jgi:hypothetical protein